MRLQLRVYMAPGQVEIFLNILRNDGDYERRAAIIDTGAAVSLLPNDLLDIISARVTSEPRVTIEQAGIASQFFQAIEAHITVTLEDQYGNISQPFEIPVWFADTKTPLVGYAGILDRSILHIDMPARNGWLDIAL